MGVFLGVAKNSNIFWGCSKFLIFFGVNSRCWSEPTYEEKMRIPPPPSGRGVGIQCRMPFCWQADDHRFPYWV